MAAPYAGEHIGETPLPLRLAKERGRSDACLKNDNAESARCQLLDERRRFSLARHLAHRRRGHGRAAHAPHQLGQFLAEPRLEQPDARTM